MEPIEIDQIALSKAHSKRQRQLKQRTTFISIPSDSFRASCELLARLLPPVLALLLGACEPAAARLFDSCSFSCSLLVANINAWSRQQQEERPRWVGRVRFEFFCAGRSAEKQAENHRAVEYFDPEAAPKTDPNTDSATCPNDLFGFFLAFFFGRPVVSKTGSFGLPTGH